MAGKDLPSEMLSSEGHVVGYHSGGQSLEIGSIAAVLHLGTLAQAKSRAGKVITKVTAKQGLCGRLVDTGSNRWQSARLQRFVTKGRDWVVYLNRHEAIDLSELHDANLKHPHIDDASDYAFRRLVPSARDSLILLDPDLIVSAEAIVPDWLPTGFADA